MKQKFKNLVLSVLIISGMYIPNLSYSQEINECFISALPANDSLNYNSSEKSKFDRVKKNKLHKTILPIKIGNIQKIVSNNTGSLPFRIPGSNKDYIAKSTYVEFYSDLNYEWRGKIGNDDSELIVICKNGELFGSLTLDTKSYEIVSLGKNKNVLIEFDNKILDKCKCAYENKETDIVKKNVLNQKAIATTAILQVNVRVLVLYSPNAFASVTDINNTAILAISQVNEALSNSMVGSVVLTRLAGVAEFDFNESSDIEVDVNRLATSANAQNLRNTNQADLVVLLTDGNYDNNGRFGIVSEIGPNDNFAYAIVEADMATGGRYTFAHEVGHLFGGRHDGDNTTGSVGYDHGYHFLTGTWPFRTDRYTLMHRLSSGSRILYYSNPSVSYKSKATGTSSDNDVARRILETGFTIEAFRAFIPPLSVTITGSTTAYNTGEYTWTANPQSGTAQYTYNWLYSYDGITYYNGFGTDKSETASMPLDRDLYLRVNVTSFDGQNASGFFKTTNLGTDPYPIQVLLSLATTENELSDKNTNKATEKITINSLNSWLIYPNPITSQACFSFSLNQVEFVKVEILDIMGRKVKDLLNKQFEKGNFNYNFSVTEIPKGMYMFRISFGSSSIVKKIFID